MLNLVTSIVSTIILIGLILGKFANAFIVIVNIIDWVKKQKISSADKILTALVSFRLSFLWVMLINWYWVMFNPVLNRLEIGMITIFWIITNHFSVWLTASLSLFYLFKIVNFSNLIFLHLKWRVERVVLVVLFGSLVFLGFQLAVVIIDDRMWMNLYERNMTLKTDLNSVKSLSNMIVFTLTNVVPFTMSLISLLLFIFSLWKHLKKIKLNAKGFQDPSTKSHIKAMLTVTSFLLLFVVYALCLITATWSYNKHQNKQTFMLCQMISIACPSSHSFILIFVNQKLKKTFLLVLWQWKERKSSTV